MAKYRDYFYDPTLSEYESLRDITDAVFGEPLSPLPIIHTDQFGNKYCINYNYPYGTYIPKISDEHLLNLLTYIRTRRMAFYTRLPFYLYNDFVKRFNWTFVENEVANRNIEL